ncbi:MAG: MBL fold metallo-hydrolase [Clostridiales bacterium]|nr:MBL fold metallo-hydrolase [Clostridiales bacterium]
MNSEKKKIAIIDVLVLVVLAIVLGISMAFSRDIELKLGLLYYAEVQEEETEPEPDDGEGDIVDYTKFPQLYVHFVDVGQGDCTIIELPDGKTMLIDGGENKKDVESAVQTFIDKTFSSDFKYFDYAILTHPDSDHCGSFDYILNKYPARVVYRPNVEAVGTEKKPYTDPGKSDLKSDAIQKSTGAYAAAVDAMYKEIDGKPNVVYVTDPSDEEQTIKGGDGDNTYSFTFYSPLSDNYGTKESDASWNDYSPIMILEYKGFKFAMSGDAEEENLGEFVARVQAAKTDGVTDKYDVFTDSYCVNVIKAGHHGSRNATTLDYLNAITTETGALGVYCVVSCGAGNSYKHPHQEALDRYRQIGVNESNILRTDLVGDITFSVHVDEQGVYKLYYGDKATKAPNLALVYKTIGSIELKWAIVAWVIYAVLVIAAIVHIVFFAGKQSGGSGSGGKSGGKTTVSKGKGGGRKK